MTYLLVSTLSMVVLVLLYALVSQPQAAALERARADQANAQVRAMQTEVVQLRPTPRACHVDPPYFSSC